MNDIPLDIGKDMRPQSGTLDWEEGSGVFNLRMIDTTRPWVSVEVPDRPSTIIGRTAMGTPTIPLSFRDVPIQAEVSSGETTPQFAPLGIPGPVLMPIGSVRMDYVYRASEWSIKRPADTCKPTPTNMCMCQG